MSLFDNIHHTFVELVSGLCDDVGTPPHQVQGWVSAVVDAVAEQL